MPRAPEETLGIVRSQIQSRFRLQTLDAKALAVCLAVLAALCAYRFYSYWTTGFFVSDEFGYYYNAAHGTIYSDRWFFGWFNIILFDVLNIRSPDTFAYLLPFYLFFWSGLTIYVFYRLLKLLEFSGPTVALSVISSFVLVSFVLLSLGFLTETTGLCLAMTGVYAIVSFLKTENENRRLVWLVAAALFFGFAGGTREPYVALEVGAIAVVVFAAFKHPTKVAGARYGKQALAGLSILFFLVPTGFMLYANTATTSTAVPLVQGIAASIITPPPAQTAVTSMITQNVTETIVLNSTTTTVTTQITHATTTLINYPFYAKSIPLNTLVIFIGGILLGWGPIAFPIGLAGLIILMGAALRRDSLAIALLVLVLSALASDLVVSFLFAPDPTYFTFSNYSTIIRFSGTALPAFFLAAPFFLARVAKSRKRVMGLVGVAVITLLILVPVYEVFAISNLGYTTVTPFGLDYRSPALLVRDYINAHPSEAPFHVVGVPYGWYFTPGVDDLNSVQVYTWNAGITLSPYLNYSSFLAKHWTNFYVYSSANFVAEKVDAPYLLQFIPGAPHIATNETTPFQIVNSTVVIRSHDFLFTRVNLVWNSPIP